MSSGVSPSSAGGDAPVCFDRSRKHCVTFAAVATAAATVLAGLAAPSALQRNARVERTALVSPRRTPSVRSRPPARASTASPGSGTRTRAPSSTAPPASLPATSSDPLPRHRTRAGPSTHIAPSARGAAPRAGPSGRWGLRARLRPPPAPAAPAVDAPRGFCSYLGQRVTLAILGGATTTIRPEYVTFAKLLHHRVFRIPEYQRAYSWTEEQRNDLFDDIEHASAPESGDFREHFMATIVIRATGKKIRDGMDEYRVCHLVDGQQRLTTLVLLLRAIAQALDPKEHEEAAVR
ncbi:MAG: DUF262 domain-containing protein [Geminicoccaceae bacterium]|nr:DUF262 domain-containing protein [Geminicoccaceae bacterium]